MPKGRHSTAGISNRTWIIGGLLVAGAVLWMRKASAQTPAPSSGNAPTPVGAPAQPAVTTVGPVSLLPIQAGTQNIPELPASSAPTSAEVTASGSFWDNLTPVPGLSSGYINFPSGAQAAASLFPTKADANGQYYVQWAGLVYVLGSQDGSGNWPAQAVG